MFRPLTVVVAMSLGCAVAPPPAPAPPPSPPEAAVSEPVAEPEPEPDMVARVNGQPVLRADFEAMVERSMRRYRNTGQTLPSELVQRVREAVLSRMIDDELITQKAAQLGVGISDELLDSRFGEYRDRFRTEQAFEDYLERSAATAAEMRQDLYREMLRDAVVASLTSDVDITDEQVAQYYAENAQRFVEREQIKASRIVLGVSDEASEEEREKVRQRAHQVRRRARQAEADFAELAREYSEGPQASRGGDLGWFARGRMPPEFDRAAFALEPGQVSRVVETHSSFEVIKVWDKRPERERTLEEVADNIRASLEARTRNDRKRTVLRDIEAAAEIETFDIAPPATREQVAEQVEHPAERSTRAAGQPASER